MKTTDLMELIVDLKELRPIILQAINEVEFYGPDLQRIMDKVGISLANSKIKMINHYMENGFSKEEAVLLTIDSIASLQRTSSSYNKK